jgi:hypothetical protein
MFLLGRLHRWPIATNPSDDLFSRLFLSILAASIIHEGSANVSNASKICWTVRPVARGVLRGASSRSLILTSPVRHLGVGMPRETDQAAFQIIVNAQAKLIASADMRAACAPLRGPLRA